MTGECRMLLGELTRLTLAVLKLVDLNLVEVVDR